MSYKLQLPDHWKVHPTFHVSLLKLHHGPAHPYQAPVFTVDDESEYEFLGSYSSEEELSDYEREEYVEAFSDTYNLYSQIMLFKSLFLSIISI